MERRHVGGVVTERTWMAWRGRGRRCPLPRKARERELRLFAVACCRRLQGWLDSLFDQERWPGWVERRLFDITRLRSISELGARAGCSGREAAAHAVMYCPLLASRRGHAWAGPGRMDDEWCPDRAAFASERRAQYRLLLDIFGQGPPRPAPEEGSIAPCLTPTVVSLVCDAYHERVTPSDELDPQLLGILADAVEDAGCADAELLGHLRDPGPHVLGCWAFDALWCKVRDLPYQKRR